MRVTAAITDRLSTGPV